MSRESIDHYYLKMLKLVASRSTCRRRQVAAIITDDQGHVLSTGYNGVPSGYQHCIDVACDGVFDKPGNTNNCMAIHAEQNALLQCNNLVRAHTIYTSTLPCFTCAKLIANTPILRVIVIDDYADQRGGVLLCELGRLVIRAVDVL